MSNYQRLEAQEALTGTVGRLLGLLADDKSIYFSKAGAFGDKVQMNFINGKKTLVEMRVSSPDRDDVVEFFTVGYDPQKNVVATRQFYDSLKPSEAISESFDERTNPLGVKKVAQGIDKIVNYYQTMRS